MNEVFILDEEFNLNGSVYEVTGISIEHKYDLNGSACEGEFIISGDYREHEISVNRNDFCFHIPFTSELRSNINLDSVEVEINDFTYELDGNQLKVHVEYTVNGEQASIEFAKEADLEEFLNNNNVEIVDLSADGIREDEAGEDSKESQEAKEEYSADELIDADLPIEEIVEEEMREEIMIEEPVKEEVIVEEEREIIHEEIIDKDDIVSSINSEESYVTYNVHIVSSADTFETLSNQYNVSVNEIKRINNIEEIIIGMKLIIPDEED